MIRLVALTGKKGAGKSTAAQALVAEGWVVEKFATPLKDMLRTLLGSTGLTTDFVERMVEGDLKEQPTRYLGGRTPRHAMQTLGTEWGRDLVSPTLWTENWMTRVERQLSRGRRVVVDDMRFENEQRAFRDVVMWGDDGVGRAPPSVTIEVRRPADASSDAHRSEAAELGWDLFLLNGGSVEALQDHVPKMLDRWSSALV